MKKLLVFVYSWFCCFSFVSIIHARDINLDLVYINPEAPLYNRLLEKKIEAYQIAHSQFIERNVIFAFWNDGFTIVYIKEFPTINIIYSYNKSNQRYNELYRLQGTITGVKNSVNGRYLFIKRIVEFKNSIPKGETIVLDIKSKNIKILESSYPFIDFSLSSDGSAILYETMNGIIEYLPESGKKSIVVKKSDYAGIVASGSPTIAYFSPNRKKISIISGSGGSYRAKIITSNSSWNLPGVTSANEIAWLNNNQIIYRKGDAGNYSVHLYDTTTRKSTALIGNSLNTNIQFSAFPKVITFLKDQIIHVYDMRQNEMINTSLEGEDVYFSPDGNWFISLYLKKLFLTNINTMRKKQPELTKVAKQIEIMYQNLLDGKKYLSNEYSQDYIRKKILLYSKISE